MHILLKCNRRHFLEASAVTLVGAPALAPLHAQSGKGKLRPGMYVNLGRNVDGVIGQVHELGFSDCEVYTDDLELELADRLRHALDHYRS